MLFGQYRAIRAITPDIQITTNMMGTFKPLDYFKWAEHIDIISWDNYPSANDHMSNIALRHDLMRGLKAGSHLCLWNRPRVNKIGSLLTA